MDPLVQVLVLFPIPVMQGSLDFLVPLGVVRLRKRPPVHVLKRPAPLVANHRLRLTIRAQRERVQPVRPVARQQRQPIRPALHVARVQVVQDVHLT